MTETQAIIAICRAFPGVLIATVPHSTGELHPCRVCGGSTVLTDDIGPIHEPCMVTAIRVTGE